MELCRTANIIVVMATTNDMDLVIIAILGNRLADG